MWWLPIVEFFGQIALKIGVAALEKRFPGIAPILGKIVEWLSGQAQAGNQQAVQALSQHVDKLCSGVGCAPELKSDNA